MVQRARSGVRPVKTVSGRLRRAWTAHPQPRTSELPTRDTPRRASRGDIVDIERSGVRQVTFAGQAHLHDMGNQIVWGMSPLAGRMLDADVTSAGVTSA